MNASLKTLPGVTYGMALTSPWGWASRTHSLHVLLALIWWIPAVGWTRPACASYDQSRSNSPLFCQWHCAASCPTWAPPRWRAGTTPAPCASWAARVLHPRLLRTRLCTLRGKACFLVWGRDRYLIPIPKIHYFLSRSANMQRPHVEEFGVRRKLMLGKKVWEVLGTFRLWCLLIPGLREDLWLDGVFGALCTGSLWYHTPN